LQNTGLTSNLPGICYYFVLQSGADHLLIKYFAKILFSFSNLHHSRGGRNTNTRTSQSPGRCLQVYMDTPRTTYISDFFYNNHTDDDFFRDRFFYLKLHALFNCLTVSEVMTLYFKHSIHSDKFKGTLLNFIAKKSHTQDLDFSEIATKLIENYSLQPYYFQIAFRTFLSHIVRPLNKEILRDYFNLFIKSKRTNDRKKSYEVANLLWADVEQIIWDTYFEFRDDGALIQIIENSASFELVTQLKNIWSKDYPYNNLKKLIIEKTHEENISYFEFLKKTEPTFYIQALIVRNQPVEKKLLLSITKKMKQEKNGFLFYYLGLAKDWDLLTDSIKTMKTEQSY